MRTIGICHLLLFAWITSISAMAGQHRDAMQEDFSDQTLHVFTWSDYLDEGLVNDFEQQTQAKVKFSYFETDEHRDLLIAEQGLRGYDLILLDSSKALFYQKQGWLSRLERDRIPNLKHLDQRCYDQDEVLSEYIVPYFWGTMGIVYRSDLAKQPISSWMQLYRPAEELKGKIVMIRESWEVLGMANMALGQSMNSERTADWETAAQLAYQQRPYVKDYGYPSTDEDSTLLSGEVWAAQIYNGEALVLQEMNEDIVYVHPEEGSGFWIDDWAVSASSEYKALAHAFLNHLNAPQNAAKNAESVYYATCNKTAEGLLSEDFLSDPVIYPPKDVMQRLEPYKNLSPRITRKMNLLFSQIVQGR